MHQGLNVRCTAEGQEFSVAIDAQLCHSRPPYWLDRDSDTRKNMELIHRMLRQRWGRLPDEEQLYWNEMEEWDQNRLARDTALFEKLQSEKGSAKKGTPKKRVREESVGKTPAVSIPKKRKS